MSNEFSGPTPAKKAAVPPAVKKVPLTVKGDPEPVEPVEPSVEETVAKDDGRFARAVKEFTSVIKDPQATAPAQPGRKVRLTLNRIDPWSVMKVAFLLSIALGVVMVVAVAIIWGVLGAVGVWSSVNDSVTNVVGDNSSSNFDVTNYVGAPRVIGFVLLVAVLNVFVLTAIATLSALLYNMAAALMGGVRVTLTDRKN